MPTENADLVLQKMLDWLESASRNWKKIASSKSEWEQIRQIGGPNESETFREKVFLDAEVIIKSKPSNAAAFAQWVTQNSLVCPLEACGEMLIMAVALALNQTNPLGLVLVSTAQLLLLKTLQMDDSSVGISSSRALAMRRLAELMDLTKVPYVFNPPNEEARELFLETFQDTLLRLDLPPDFVPVFKLVV